MIVLSHPSGNTFVRALLAALEAEGLLERFFTTVAVEPDTPWLASLPARLRQELLRRTYPTAPGKITVRPLRELVRLAAGRSRFLQPLTRHERGWASVDAVYSDLDIAVARELPRLAARGVYCYEDGALETFRTARELGVVRFYDLPIAYWQTSRRLLEEEANRLPEWEPTLVGTRDSQAKFQRKSEEVELADAVICPSQFVLDSLPETIRTKKTCLVAQFGSPAVADRPRAPRTDGLLRVLFAGSLTQRKGLADLFRAVKLAARRDIELVVMGSPVAPLEFYRSRAQFTYEPPRPHGEVLELMASCDVLALPSIVEGRALVQQEAMMCRLPLLATANAGGEDLIEEGRTGFLVPIRSPEAIAEKLSYLADHRDSARAMGEAARERAVQTSWPNYCRKIISLIRDHLSN